MGRPTVMTTENIAKLEEAFLNMATDEEACFIADISETALYDFCRENPEFAKRKEALKNKVKYNAKMNIAKAIGTGDKTLSQWFLERRDSDYKPKQETENKGGVNLIVRSYGEADPIIEKIAIKQNGKQPDAQRSEPGEQPEVAAGIPQKAPRETASPTPAGAPMETAQPVTSEDPHAALPGQG